MADENQQGGGGNGQIIVVKKKARGGHGGHHGGAWKVAYADFVTAMMAFFLLLWLLSSTTQEQKIGIAHYFNPPNNSTQYGGGQGIMGGTAVVETPDHAPADVPVVPAQQDNNQDMALQAKEDALFRQVAETLKKQVMNIPELKALLDNLLVDITPEGLRITITDAKGRELFKNGSAEMYPYTERMVALVASVVAPLPNQLAIGGHTDAAPYRGADPAYTNWELSADRAQAARRVLGHEGLPDKRFERVAGYASQEPLLVDQPEDIKNRRITIIVLRSKKGALAQFSQEGLIAPQMGPFGPEQ
ncbi:MAG: flagellar motor protein MotB [Proteobacteria bacterium]|nr:flagellar motor protein MotB [Pseudomonadota bacterium]